MALVACVNNKDLKPTWAIQKIGIIFRVPINWTLDILETRELENWVNFHKILKLVSHFV